MITGQIPTGLKINDIAYSVNNGKFVATMITGDADSWRFEYSGDSSSPNVKIWSSDCDEKDLICQMPTEVLFRTILKLEDISFRGIGAVLAVEELTWLRMCWVLAHYGDLSVSINSKDQQRPYISKAPRPTTIQAKLGITGLRLFIYFHVDSGVVLESTIISAATLEFLREKSLNSKLSNKYHNSTAAIQELFVRKGSFQPLL